MILYLVIIIKYILKFGFICLRTRQHHHIPIHYRCLYAYLSGIGEFIDRIIPKCTHIDIIVYILIHLY